MHQFSIIIPTYNRANNITVALDSLKEQGAVDLECIIIDDGSKDNTKDVVSNYNAPFKITYQYQQNAGKATAVNKGIELADSLITFVLDSDDALLPNTLPFVWQYFDSSTNTFKENSVCLAGLCIYDNNKIVGNKFPYDYYISNRIDYIYNKKISGDKCDFYLTDIYKQYPYPVFKGEKYIAPSAVWNRIALKYNTLYINKEMLLKFYLKGGLTDIKRDLWDNSPQCSELYTNEATHHFFKLKIRIKNYARYIYFAKKNKKSLKEIYLGNKYKKLFLPGFFTYFIYYIFKKLKNIDSFYRLCNRYSRYRRFLRISQKNS